jgi:hypothetical protein
LLSNNAGITALVDDRIYDWVPQATDSGSDLPFPYITIGDDSSVDWSTKTEIGQLFAINVHSWSRGKSKIQNKDIQGAIRKALDRAEPVISGYNVVSLDYRTTSAPRSEPDNLTHHGIVAYQMYLQENS